MAPKQDSPEISRLRRLASQPREQAAYACSLLAPHLRRDVLLAATDVLTIHPKDEARGPLLDLYRHYAERGEQRDPGCYMRRALLAALRPLAQPADLPLMLAAVETYEFLPPDFREEATLLRSGALVILSELNEELARYHAARLLIDSYVETMSGEPALTAARVLAGQGENAVLYSYAMRHGAGLSEVMSEALRSLTTLPAALVPGLVQRHRETEDGFILVGLFDLLVNHEEGLLQRAFLEEYLRNGDNPDALRYLAVTAVARGDELLIDELMTAARMEQKPARAAAYLEALTLLPESGPVADLRRALEERLQPRAGG